MFENGKPVPHARNGDASAPERRFGRVDSASDRTAEIARAGEALRAIEWSELTARLNAARDLRRELRNDAMLCAGASGARFGDAAASFFKALGTGERPVNPDSLEACKASCGKASIQAEAAAQGDARDTI